MKSTVTVEINLPQAKVAELFSNIRKAHRRHIEAFKAFAASGVTA